MMTVGVFGSSGFVGATLVERLLLEKGCQVKPFIHEGGNAWRLARRGLELKPVDLLSQVDVTKAVAGCTHVVNCTRGPEEVMFQGLRNLLRSSRQQRVARFVHLSSVAVYGERPAASSTREDASPSVTPGSYGAIKLRQDEMVFDACRRGLPCIVLCPPHITGPYSAVLGQILDLMREGRFALVDNGVLPCNLVDVNNLVEAIVLGLSRGQSDGTRIFVTDDEPTTWHDLAEALSIMAGRAVPTVNREAVPPLKETDTKVRYSPLRSLKHMMSSGVREAMRTDPLLGVLEGSAKDVIKRMPRWVLDRVEAMARGPSAVSKVEDQSPYDERFLQQQLRNVRHGCQRAKDELGYSPIFTFSQSMNAYGAWYESLYGWHSDMWSLQSYL